jgi:hypothetical protein
MQKSLDGDSVVWLQVREDNPQVCALADRHYSRKTVGSPQVVGPATGKMILLTGDGSALFIWRKNKYRMDGQDGVECSIFRNEGLVLSSDLVREAVRLARIRWPAHRLFTYVRPTAIRSTNPGHCFIMAGWKKIGRNKYGDLIIFEAPQE